VRTGRIPRAQVSIAPAGFPDRSGIRVANGGELAEVMKGALANQDGLTLIAW
jgi:hypothetical protein